MQSLPPLPAKAGFSEQMLRELAACKTPEDYERWLFIWADRLAGRVLAEDQSEALPYRPVPRGRERSWELRAASDW